MRSWQRIYSREKTAWFNEQGAHLATARMPYEQPQATCSNPVQAVRRAKAFIQSAILRQVICSGGISDVNSQGGPGEFDFAGGYGARTVGIHLQWVQRISTQMGGGGQGDMGHPDVFISDQAPHVKRGALKLVATKLGACHRFSVAYSSWSNDTVKRMSFKEVWTFRATRRQRGGPL